MPDVANNRRLAFVIGMKFMLFAFATALFCVGSTATAADDVGRPTDPISRGEKKSLFAERPTPLSAANSKLLDSLRFWEKIKLPPSPKPPIATQPVPSRPQEIPSANGLATKGTSNTGAFASQSNSPPTSSAAMGSAPKPPPNPYTENEKNVGDAPMPTGYARTHEQDDTTPRTEQTNMDSYSSYSFDTRDWVEFFPVQHKQEPDRVDAPAVPQLTSLRVPTMPSIQKQSEEDMDQWNGLATALATNLQRDPVPAAETVHDEELSLLDLSPSYRKRLPYVQTCGVVVVQANFPLTEIASILEEINQLQDDLYHYIRVPAPKEKIELCLFKNEETYTSFLREFFPRAPCDRRALYVKLDNKPGTLMIQKSKDFEVDLRHEMTHAIIHASISKVPIWLDEGLAKYFEIPSRDRKENHPYLSQVRWSTKLGTVPSLNRLEKLETIDDMGTKEYRDSWAWTHFLIHRSPETHQLLAAYLQMLATCPDAEVYVTGGSDFTLISIGEKLFGRDPNKTGRVKPVAPLKPLLDNAVPNQRETFKEHFATTAK